jgi:hypothetical protein
MPCREIWSLEVEAWQFSGAWGLEFGALSRPRNYHATSPYSATTFSRLRTWVRFS